MKHAIPLLTALLPASLAALTSTVRGADATTALWFDQPATSFHQSLPLGNGRIGAMVFGGVDEERIVLNESSVWSGSREDADRPDAHKVLSEIRRLLLEGKNIEAERLVNANFTCQGKGSGHANGANLPFGCYQTLGNLRLEFTGLAKETPRGWSWVSAASEDDAMQVAKSGSADRWQPTDMKGAVLDVPIKHWKVFRTTFRVADDDKDGWVVDFGALDDTSVVFVNGREVGRTSAAHWEGPHRIACGDAVKAGTNVLTFAVSNIGGPGRMAGDVRISRGASAEPRAVKIRVNGETKGIQSGKL